MSDEQLKRVVRALDRANGVAIVAGACCGVAWLVLLAHYVGRCA